MLRHASLKLIACCLALSACVTINVYFPAAAAEKAADKIIEDVWGPDTQQGTSKQPEKSSQKPSDKRSSLLEIDGQRVLLAAAGSVLNFLVPVANAQADLNIATPAVRQL